MRGARTKFVEADMVNARGVDRVVPPGSRTAVEGVEDGPADLVREHTESLAVLSSEPAKQRIN